MSLKAEIVTWAAALEAFDAQDYDRAIDLFSEIADNSKILTNIGLIYASLGQHELAVDNFRAATSLDSYLAIAYFQSGVSNFILRNFDWAFQDFEEALLHLRDNQAINYDQLGLKFQLYAAEVIFNKGLCMIQMDNVQEGTSIIREACDLKVTEEHQAIDEALAVRGEGFTVFSVPPGVLYRPNEKKMRNVHARDWLGKAKLISAPNEQEEFTGFGGSSRKQTQDTSADLVRARSRSASATTGPSPTRDGSTSGPPQPSLLARGASTGSPTILLPGLNRSPTTGILVSPGKGATVPGRNIDFVDAAPVLNSTRQSEGLPMPRPSLRITPDVKPLPSPPQSYSPPRRPRKDLLDPYRSAYSPDIQEEGNPLADIYEGYLRPISDYPMLPPIETGLIPISVQGLSGNDGLQRFDTQKTTKTANAYTNTLSGAREYRSRSFNDNQSRSSASSIELTKIRVKLHFQNDVRGMTCYSTVSFKEFTDKICDKFGYPPGGLRMQFEDHDDGSKVSLRDEMDFDMALETAKENARASGRIEGRLVVWCLEDYL